MTVIFSTHHVDLVSEIADYVYVMDGGQIVAKGTVEDIFDQQQLLSDLRLDVPPIPKLIKKLKDQNVDIEMAYKYDDAEKSFLKAFGKLK